MNLSIMQPYLFPYIGYFQLIACSDIFVIYDDVQFIKNGWVNRNRILLEGKPHWLTLPVRGARHDLPINRRHYAVKPADIAKVLRKLESAYRKAPHFDRVYPLVADCLNFPETNIGTFNTHAIRKLALHLGLDTKMPLASDVGTQADLHAEARVIAICKQMGARRYINPAGGINLYDATRFADQGIELRFLVSDQMDYPQFSAAPVGSLSIIDVLMFNTLDSVKAMLNRYRLMSAAAMYTAPSIEET